ncbi:Ribonuclease H-like superfamily [Sesbania bispinosa]|nr:Ribonuclease H-like superfamily [Sesbania bispinosa]
MGYIYEAMDKAKEAIMKSFNNNESKYKDVFAIIDDRWTCQLHRPLHAAGHFFNPEFFYDNPQLEFDLEVTDGLYDCIKRLVPSKDVQQSILLELPMYKNAAGLFGSDFAKLQRKTIAPGEKLRLQLLIHSKKRNKLDHKKLHDLVYVKYNQLLKQRYNLRDEIDPISLNDIDECNEWLVGEMDGNDEDVGNELVFDDDETLNWATIYEASGVGEPRTYTRQWSRKRKEPASAATIAKTSKKGAGASSKGKSQVVVEDDEPKFEDNQREKRKRDMPL